MLLLIDHGATMPSGVVLHGHEMALLHMVRHLAVRVERLAGPALLALIEAPVSPVDRGTPHLKVVALVTLCEQLTWESELLLQHNTGGIHLKQRFVCKRQV